MFALFVLPIAVLGIPPALVVAFLLPSPDSSGNESGISYFFLMSFVFGLLEIIAAGAWGVWWFFLR